MALLSWLSIKLNNGRQERGKRRERAPVEEAGEAGTWRAGGTGEEEEGGKNETEWEDGEAKGSADMREWQEREKILIL